MCLVSGEHETADTRPVDARPFMVGPWFLDRAVWLQKGRVYHLGSCSATDLENGVDTQPAS